MKPDAEGELRDVGLTKETVSSRNAPFQREDHATCIQTLLGKPLGL